MIAEDWVNMDGIPKVSDNNGITALKIILAFISIDLLVYALMYAALHNIYNIDMFWLLTASDYSKK